MNKLRLGFTALVIFGVMAGQVVHANDDVYTKNAVICNSGLSLEVAQEGLNIKLHNIIGSAHEKMRIKVPTGLGPNVRYSMNPKKVKITSPVITKIDNIISICVSATEE